MNILNLPIQHKDAPEAVKAAIGAGKIILEVYSSDFKAEYKAEHEPVTQADKRSDSHIIECLKASFPVDRILTEEHGLYTPSNNVSDRLWIIDPVDGTQEFINRTGDFAVQIGMAEAGELKFGLVYQPVTGFMYIAAKGEGCWKFGSENGWERLFVPKCDYSDLTIMISRNHECTVGQAVHKALNGKNRIAHGGVGLKLMAIAEKRAHYYINNSNKTKAWDSAAPEILFTEAGGVITDLTGHKFSYDPEDFRHKHGLVASCSQDLHNKILEIVKEMGIYSETDRKY